jgi:outer membrane protein TolC
VLQADVTLSDSRQKLLTEDNLRSLRASKVNSLLLRPLNDDTRAEEIAASPSAGISLDDAWAVAEAESPELKELDAAIRSKEASVSAARSEYLPNIYVSGGYEYQENRYMVHEDNWSLIAGVNINLFSGGASSAKIRMGKGEVFTLKMTRDKLLDSVRLAVKGAYLDLQSSSKKIDVTKTAVAQAEENLRLQRLRYQEGVGTATEVLDAVTLLTVAQTNYWKAVYGLKRAEANLLYAMGRDLVGLYGK